MWPHRTKHILRAAQPQQLKQAQAAMWQQCDESWPADHPYTFARYVAWQDVANVALVGYTRNMKLNAAVRGNNITAG
jgi:hypothetical protein